MLYTGFMQRKTTLIAFRVKPELKVTLEKLAKRDSRSLSNYIELALQKHVDTVMPSKKDE
jgi:predicted DNA-binding protein